VDVFSQFIDTYEQGRATEALQLLFPTPDICYDAIPSSSLLINFADEKILGDAAITDYASQALMVAFAKDEKMRVIADTFLAIVRDEAALKIFLHQLVASPIDVGAFNPLIQFHIAIKKRIDSLLQKKDALQALLSPQTVNEGRPFHRFAYTFEGKLHPLSPGEIPLILLEPSSAVDYATLLAPFVGKPVVFVCETFQDLYQMLQWESVAKALEAPHSLLYLMSAHPKEQVETAPWQAIKGKTLAPMTLRPVPHAEAFFPRLAEALTGSSPLPDLYHLCKLWLTYRIQQRYGKSRALPLRRRLNAIAWFDPHKERPSPSVSLGFTYEDPILTELQEVQKKRVPRPWNPQKPLKLVHIVPQIVDGGHAPSRLLRMLVSHADQSQFEIAIISTESLLSRYSDYPVTPFFSSSSKERAAQTLETFQKKGIPVLIYDQDKSIKTLGEEIAQQLDTWNTAIAVFHGPDEINMWAAAKSNVPMRVLFEHGTPPQYPCFESAILSSEESLKTHQERLQSLHINPYALNFCIDIRQTWSKEPFTKEHLGFPKDAFIMTTVSNHLDTRLSPEMVYAISEILKRHPHAYYAPMGKVQNEPLLRAQFEKHGVGKQVKFLGAQKQPSQIARSMELYLNEFPFGSCLGMLDAMAAGCPVVSMYDPQGPQQARYAGAYFGMDRVITSNKVEDYIDLASRLISDKKLYTEWSHQAQMQYQHRADEKAYVKAFEKIVQERLP